MKKQNGFISSSSSVATAYNTFKSGTGTGKTVVTTRSQLGLGTQYSSVTQLWDSYGTTSSYSWNTYTSNCYERIESFLQAVETLGAVYSTNGTFQQIMMNYSTNVAKKQIYNGFVDFVITFPCNIRLAGIQLLNPWVSEKYDSQKSQYWKYLPTKFSIYKVKNYTILDNSKVTLTNDAGLQVSYQNDVARFTSFDPENQTYRPIKYNKLQNDPKLIFLGSYSNISWKNRSSLQCFFKYNPDDEESKNLADHSERTGTATWDCKQLVIRIFESKIKTNHSQATIKGQQDTYIKQLLYEYIRNKQNQFGTTFNGLAITTTSAKKLYGKTNISSLLNDDQLLKQQGLQGFNFGSTLKRSYDKAGDVKFRSGVNYKLGGIQLLLSPDIFSISEMKMYNYAGRVSNKVYIGQYDANGGRLFYYGAKTIKKSQLIDINQNSSLIKWRHNFNIPTNYLQGQIYVRFNMDYGTFRVGDTINNIVNTKNAPLSLKLTNNEISVNLSNGIGFTNPQTGQFMSFMNGVGIQMDRPGEYAALKGAIKVGANIISAGSSVAASITGGCPFQIYFIVKRLF